MSRDWRESAYLQKSKWPEAIAWDGPHREHGPKPWAYFAAYEGIDDVDEYPSSHTSAGSIGDDYLGDVCPYCGVPVRWTEEVVLEDGTEGVFAEISTLDEPEPGYHPECWRDRQAEKHGQENTSLGEWA